MEFDMTGRYYYRPGWCCRDAFAQHFGSNHPIVQEMPRDITMDQLRAICRRYGLEHEISHAGFPERSFAADAVAIWIFTDRPDNPESHTVYCSAARIVEVQAERGMLICGYVLLEDYDEK